MRVGGLASRESMYAHRIQEEEEAVHFDSEACHGEFHGAYCSGACLAVLVSFVPSSWKERLLSSPIPH